MHRQSASWKELADFFEPDGSLCDIYINGTSSQDWDRVLHRIAERYSPLEFSVDGEPAQLPSAFQDILQLKVTSSPSLSFKVRGIEVACHFFNDTEIEFDIGPEQINRPEQLESLLEFMRELARVTSKSVTITPESLHDSPFVRVDESGLAECV